MEHPHLRHGSLIGRDDSVLCVIDVQPHFLAKLEPGACDRLVDSARFVVEVARRLAIPRFVTVDDPSRNGATVDAIRSCLGPADADRDQLVFGLAGQPDLIAALLAQPRRTAVLIGLETDVCILHSAVGLAECGFRAVIVADATGAPGGEHALGLERARRSASRPSTPRASTSSGSARSTPLRRSRPGPRSGHLPVARSSRGAWRLPEHPWDLREDLSNSAAGPARLPEPGIDVGPMTNSISGTVSAPAMMFAEDGRGTQRCAEPVPP
jgi:nicotinamidase-related amidase